MTTAVNTLQDIAQACDLPPEVVRAVVMNSDRPEAMHLELTAGWLSHLGADVIDVQDSFIHFTARDGGRWWELHAIDEGGYLNAGVFAARFHEYSLHCGPMMEPVWIDGGFRPAELAGRALWHARQIEGQR